MIPAYSTKEKILAVLSVFFLFLIAGSLFFYISLNNKKRTSILNKAVMQERLRLADEIRLSKVNYLATTTAEISSKSFLSLITTKSGNQKILVEHNPLQVLPIASITKLMVALIVMENIDLKTEVKATLDYIGGEESAYILESDKYYTVKELLANALISSDNDSARLISSVLGEANFLAKMNDRAKALGLTQTEYFNVTGLDPNTRDLNQKVNVSTVNDLANLLLYIKEKYPQILQITLMPDYNFCDVNNACRVVKNTNKLLNADNFKYEILGGKTGTTDLALKNLILIVKLTDEMTLFNIVLGSADNFLDTSTIINQIVINE